MFNDGYVLHSESNIDDDGIETVIETAAFKMDFIFVSKVGWFNATYPNITYDDYYYYDEDDEDDDIEEEGIDITESDIERLLGKKKKPKSGKQPKCKPKHQLVCCVADQTNGNEEENVSTTNWCEKKGCTQEVCPKNVPDEDRRRLNSKSSKQAKYLQPMIDNDLYGTDYNKILEKYTVLDPISTGAVLDATSLEEMAECRASNYNTTEYGTPSLECGEYNLSSCEENDYIIVETNETDIDDNFCLPDDFYCIDDDLCTMNTWDPDNFTCTTTPVSCPDGQSCDSVDG